MSPRPAAKRRSKTRRHQPKGVGSFRCRVCRGVHALRKCQRFLKLSAEKRLRAVLVNEYCPNCLAHQHSNGTCRSGDFCRKCQGDHHSLLHLDEQQPQAPAAQPRSRSSSAAQPRSRSSSAAFPRSRSPPASSGSRASTASSSYSPSKATRSPSALTRPPSSGPSVSLASLMQRKSVSVLPTARVIFDTGLKTFETMALLDPCSPISLIDASLARAFGLVVTSVGEEKACTAIIRSKTSPTLKLEVVFQVDPKLQCRTPIRAIPSKVRDQFGNITLADEDFFRPSTVSIVLGCDIYQDIILPGVVPSQDGLPLAQNTVFGWVLSGTCSQ